MDNNTGAVFTQSGVPVRGSADYQRVFDSRWKFLEVEFESDIKVVLPAVPGVAIAAEYYERTVIMKHGLGFIPAFEATDMPSGVSIFANKQEVFLRRLILDAGAIEQAVNCTVRIYNLPILEDYVAPKGIPFGTSSPRSTTGIKFLDGKTPGVEVGDDSDAGFSVDTTKKILSIHRHGLADINSYIRHPNAGCSAIDTTTNILTLTPPNPSYTFGEAADISWLQTPGAVLIYTPNDFATWPGGMANAFGIRWYSIPIDATHIRLASSYENAIQGIAVDITSTGSLPGIIQATNVVGDNQDAIFHDVGYPPTYLLAPLNRDEVVFYKPNYETYIGPMVDYVMAFTKADNKYLYFKGVQSMFGGQYGYIILKDPAEIAG